MRHLTFLTVLIILTSCSEHTAITVDIDTNKLTINSRLINKGDFERKLKTIIDSLVNSGLDKSSINVFVTADKQISEFEMSEIEKAIRRQGVDREYSWTEKD